MTVFLTGATGFLGSYVVDLLLKETDAELALLTRARSREEGVEKLWKALQLHMDGDAFYRALERIRFIGGDLTEPGLGISAEDRAYVVANAESVLHIAASLNRKSEKSCLNHNLRGTLSVIQLAQAIHAKKGLRRFSHVSTVAVAGQRDREVVQEDLAIDWDRSDYDPYGRTKKFCEHMVRSLMPSDVALTFFRPSIVMGDSRFPETTQFDMVRAFCVLADLPVIPFRGDVRMDIVNADWVGRAIATLHMKAETEHQIYHLSSGLASKTADEIAGALVRDTGRKPPRFSVALEKPFAFTMDQLASLKSRNPATLVGSLFKVFLPYITYDTVFDNARAVDEVGVAPVPFTSYCGGLYRFAKGHSYAYPYRPLPPAPAKVVEPTTTATRVAARAGTDTIAATPSAKSEGKPAAKKGRKPSARPPAKRVDASASEPNGKSRKR
jgi:thioester reductase-like protein